MRPFSICSVKLELVCFKVYGSQSNLHCKRGVGVPHCSGRYASDCLLCRMKGMRKAIRALYWSKRLQIVHWYAWQTAKQLVTRSLPNRYSWCVIIIIACEFFTIVSIISCHCLSDLSQSAAVQFFARSHRSLVLAWQPNEGLICLS